MDIDYHKDFYLLLYHFIIAQFIESGGFVLFEWTVITRFGFFSDGLVIREMYTETRRFRKKLLLLASPTLMSNIAAKILPFFNEVE